MNWKPSKAELELIADAGFARVPAIRIATALGVTVEEFSAWARSLVAAREAPCAAMVPHPAPLPPLRQEKVTPRIVADRVFEVVGRARGT